MTEQLNGRLARGVVAIANVSVLYRPGPAQQVGRVLAQRMIVVHDRWRRLPAAERQSTLVHEMTHTAHGSRHVRAHARLARRGHGHVRVPRRPHRRGHCAREWPGPDDRSSAGSRAPARSSASSGREQGAAYAAASAAAYAIVARAGTKGLFRLYDAFNDGRFRGRPGARLTDRVLRRSVGLSLAELDAQIAG